MKKYSMPQLIIVDLNQSDVIATSGINTSSPAVSTDWADDSEQLARARGGEPIWD